MKNRKRRDTEEASGRTEEIVSEFVVNAIAHMVGVLLFIKGQKQIEKIKESLAGNGLGEGGGFDKAAFWASIGKNKVNSISTPRRDHALGFVSRALDVVLLRGSSGIFQVDFV